VECLELNKQIIEGGNEMLFKMLSIPIALIKDVVTLGGAVNDAQYSNGNRTYTGKVFHEIGQEIKLKEDLKTLESIYKTIKKLNG